MTDWKRLVRKGQATTFILPSGWTPRDKVAETLGCSVDRVTPYMAPLIKQGVVEMKAFSVYDKQTDRVMRVTAYRETGKKGA